MADTVRDDAHTGRCRCGAVEVVAQGAPLQTSYCHCTDCRKATAAPVSAFVGFRRDRVSIAGALAVYRQDAVTRSFCPACGTPVAYDDSRLPDSLWLMLGVMDRPELYAPQLHAFAGHRLPWLEIADGLPRRQGFSVRRGD